MPLSTRSHIGIARLWETYSTADKHAVTALSLHASDESLESRAAARARDTGGQPTTAGLILGLAIGLRLGVQWGHTNAVRNRAIMNARRKKAKPEPEPPQTPLNVDEEFAAARRWTREMGKIARHRR